MLKTSDFSSKLNLVWGFAKQILDEYKSLNLALCDKVRERFLREVSFQFSSNQKEPPPSAYFPPIKVPWIFLEIGGGRGSFP